MKSWEKLRHQDFSYRSSGYLTVVGVVNGEYVTFDSNFLRCNFSTFVLWSVICKGGLKSEGLYKDFLGFIRLVTYYAHELLG